MGTCMSSEAWQEDTTKSEEEVEVSIKGSEPRLGLLACHVVIGSLAPSRHWDR